VQISNLLAPDLRETLKTDPAQAAELAEELHDADLAELIDGLPDDLAVVMLGTLSEAQAAPVLDSMEKGRRAELFERLDRAKAARIADGMSPDERADLFQSLPDEVSADLLARMPKDASSDVRELLRYPENSAGGRMTTDYVTIAPHLTVEKAIEEVRKSAAEKETINEVYAVDQNGALLGAVSLKTLVLARAGQPISAVMNPDVISVRPDMDQEDVARLFAHYDLLAVPVVDEGRKLIGIVTVDDVVTVLKQEQAEDIQKLGAVQPTEGGYFQTDFWTFVRKRAGWLIAIFMGEILTASVLEHYEAARRAFTAIEVFVPLIISSGGNTGSQASSLVIRGLALGEVSIRDIFKIFWREVRMGLVLGAFLGTIGLGRALLVGHSGGGGMAAAVGLALVVCVTFGSVVGALLPLIIKAIGFDPAVSSGPFIASLVDVAGIVIYLKIAITILGAPHPP
jgi:magnesium transporter